MCAVTFATSRPHLFLQCFQLHATDFHILEAERLERYWVVHLKFFSIKKAYGTNDKKLRFPGATCGTAPFWYVKHTNRLFLPWLTHKWNSQDNLSGTEKGLQHVYLTTKNITNSIPSALVIMQPLFPVPYSYCFQRNYNNSQHSEWTWESKMHLLSSDAIQEKI